MTPSQVTVENQDYVRNRLFGGKRKPTKWNYDVGDKVRISKARMAFRKGYLSSWSDEIFTIDARLSTDPATYELADLNGEDKGDILRRGIAEDFEGRQGRKGVENP